MNNDFLFKKNTVYIANFQTQNKLLVFHKQDYPSEYMSIAKYSVFHKQDYPSEYMSIAKYSVFHKQDYPSEYMSIAKYSNKCRNKKFFAERSLVFRNRIFLPKGVD